MAKEMQRRQTERKLTADMNKASGAAKKKKKGVQLTVPRTKSTKQLGPAPSPDRASPLPGKPRPKPNFKSYEQR